MSALSQTAGGASVMGGQNTANLKGKLVALEEMIVQLGDEMNFHKGEVL